MQASPLFRTFCEFFQLDATQAGTWRTALSQATGAAARRWGREVQAFDLEPPHGHEKLALVWAFFETVSPPHRMVAVLEALVEEQVLSRRDASLIENKVLARVNREGQWTC